MTAGGEPAWRVERLERAGLLKPAEAAPPLELVRTAGPRPAAGASGVTVLLEERRTGQ